MQDIGPVSQPAPVEASQAPVTVPEAVAATNRAAWTDGDWEALQLDAQRS